MSVQKPASWIYTEEFVPEPPALEAARRRGEELGATPVLPGTGAALRLLAASVQAHTVVEIGTGAGVSALWLLEGMPSDGVLTTIDIEAEHLTAAKAAFAAEGVRSTRTRAICGRAGDVLPLARGAGGRVLLAFSGTRGALYDRIRAHSGTGAAPLLQRRCGGCRLELNVVDLGRFRSAAEDEVLRCEECGRILVRTPESGL